MNHLDVLRRFNRIVSPVAPHWAAALADRQFWRPRRLPMRSWEQAASEQAQRVTTRFGLSALRWGQGGPAVLLLHGWEGRPTQFAALIEPLLAAGRQVIALDAPAHGQSLGDEANPVVFADALMEISAELPRLEAVIGHSMGAAAVAIALSRGLRCDRVVLIAGPSSLQGVLDRGAALLGLGERARAHLHHRTEQRIGLPVPSLDIARIGSSMLVPALIVHDQHDALVPSTEAEAIARVWPGARLLRTRGLGHWRVLREPSVVRAVSHFVTSGAAVRAADRSQAPTLGCVPQPRVDRQRPSLQRLPHYG